MPTSLELRAQRANIWERAKELIDTAEAEGRNLTAEEETNWEKINNDLGDFDKRIARLEQIERHPMQEMDLRKVLNAPEQAITHEAKTHVRATPEYHDAFWSYMRFGRDGVEPEQRQLLRYGVVAVTPQEARALGVSTAVAGGYFVPDSFLNRLEQAQSWFGGMREVATVIATDSGEDLALPTSNDTTNTGRILAENTVVTEQDATMGQKVYKSYMYSSDLIRVSFQFLQDSAIDAEGWLAGLLAERIGRILNTHFTTGAGANQPTGIAIDSVVGVTGATGQTTSVTFDDIIGLEHAINISYRRGPGVRYMGHDNTLRDLRRIKDGEGRYLWQPGVVGNTPATLNGYPYTVNNDVATMAASARSIFFGALSKYIIRDVRGFMLLRLEERYADFAQVGFVGFSRHDGGLLDAGTNPVQHYANSAT